MSSKKTAEFYPCSFCNCKYKSTNKWIVHMEKKHPNKTAVLPKPINITSGQKINNVDILLQSKLLEAKKQRDEADRVTEQQRKAFIEAKKAAETERMKTAQLKAEQLRKHREEEEKKTKILELQRIKEDAEYELSADQIKKNMEKNGTNCAICLVEPRRIALVPCGHAVFCSGCAKRLLQCPLCRKKITLYLKLYM